MVVGQCVFVALVANVFIVVGIAAGLVKADFGNGHIRSLAQAAGGFDCASALARETIVIFPGPEAPYLQGDLQYLMPHHTVNVSPDKVGLLSLSDPGQSACASSLTDLGPGQTLVFWDDGNLRARKSSLPGGLTIEAGNIIVFKQPGNPNPGLDNLSFLKGLTSVGGLSIYNMDALTSMSGLDRLVNITGDLIISENDKLVNLTGLNSLTSVGGDLLMNSNMNLRTLDGLNNLQTIGGQLLLKGNGYLMGTEALSSLRRVGTSVTLVNNGNLQMTLPDGVAVGPNAVVTSNPSRGDDPGGYEGQVLVIYGGAAPPSAGDVNSAAITYMPPLESFDISIQNVRFQPYNKGVSTTGDGGLKGHVIVYDRGDIPSLKPSLSSVTRITGSLLIMGGVAVGNSPSQNGGLGNLDGLQALQSVGSLGIVGSPQLKDLSGLSGLGQVAGSLVVIWNPSLRALTGLAVNAAPTDGGGGAGSDTGLTQAIQSIRGGGRRLAQEAPAPAPVPGLSKVPGSLHIQGNPNLITLQGLEGLTEVGWRLHIESNAGLTSLQALQAVRRVGGYLKIITNNALPSTAGLASLATVGFSTHIMFNKALQDVAALGALTNMSGDVVISGNPNITSLQPLQNLQRVGLNMIVAQTNVADLTGLGALASVGGIFAVSSNPRLTSLAGLSSLATVGDNVQINDNRALASLAPMDTTLQKVGGGVYILDNPALTTLGPLPNSLGTVGGLVDVGRNGAIPAAQISALNSKSLQAQGLAIVPTSSMLAPSLAVKAGLLPASAVPNTTAPLPMITSFGA